MTVDNKFKDEKLQDDINTEAAKISAFSSGKVEKYDYLTGEEIFPSDQRRYSKLFNYSPVRKALEKQENKIKEENK